MGLSGCVTIVLYIIQFLNERKKNTKNGKTIKINTAVRTSDSIL